MNGFDSAARPSIAWNRHQLALLGALVLIVVGFAAWDPAFVGLINIGSLVLALSYTVVAALALYLIILLGHIDLAIGSAMALTAAISCVLIRKAGWPAPAAMGLTLVLVVGCYALMGLLVAWGRIPSFIVTLGGLTVFRGLAERIIEQQAVACQRGTEANLLAMFAMWRLPGAVAWGLLALGAVGMALAVLHRRAARSRNGLVNRPWWLDLFGPSLAIGLTGGLVALLERDLGVPLCLPIMAAIVVAVWFVVEQTRFGRWCLAVGGNAEAARLSGIPNQRVTFGAFLIAGVLAALAGFLITSFNGSANNTLAELMELDAIAACVIGGVALSGGTGSVGGVVLGALLIVCLMNGMNFLPLHSADKQVVRGVVVVLAVGLNVLFTRRR